MDGPGTEEPLPPEDPPEGIDALLDQLERMRPVWRRIRRNWTWGLLGVLAATLVVGAYAFFVFRPPYKSEAVIFYQPDINPESLGQQTAGRVDPNFLRELVFRRGRLESLVHEMGLHEDTVEDYGIGVAVQELERDISFKPVGKSTFRLSYIGDSPEGARDVTAWLANHLVEEESDRRRQQAVQSKEFLDEELARTSDELAKHEAKLGEFIARHPRFATANNEAAREAKLSGGQRTASTPSSPSSKKRYVVRHVPAGDGQSSPAPFVDVEPDPTLVKQRQAALDELTNATRGLADVRRSYTDAHPDVVSAIARVATAEQQVKAATEAVNASTATQLYAQAAPPEPTPTEPRRVAVRVPVPASEPEKTAKSATDATSGKPTTLEELEAMDPSELGAVETEWMRLKRAVDEAQNRQTRLAAESFRAEVQSRSQSSGHGARAVILDAAYVPDEPMRSRLFFGKIWAPLAALLAALIVLGRAIVDDRVCCADDLDELDAVPMLAAIPPHANV